MIRRLMQMLVVLCGLCSITAYAACRSTGASQTEDDRTAPIVFGTVNLTSAYLQPVGSLIGRAIVPPTKYTFGGANAATVLWECDLADAPNIQFLVATNGDDQIGGFWDLGKNDGLANVYATYYRYVGLKQTMDGTVISRTWQALPVKNYATVGGKIQIRLQDLPTLYAELYRVSSLAPGSGHPTAYCGGVQIATGAYSCIQPNTYIQLKGPGLTGDSAGQDSAYNFAFWGVDNGFGYGMRTGNTLWNEPTCVARNATPLVMFNTMSVDALQAGLSAQANFNVSVECSNQAVSGTASRQTAIGIQPSLGAYTAAQRLNLLTGQNGVTALLSDNYDDAEAAKGVGIFLKNSNTGAEMNFVGQPGLSGGGAAAGWYPVLSGAQPNGSTESGYTHYVHSYTATLKKLPGAEPVKAGKVHSTAYVLVKVQ